MDIPISLHGDDASESAPVEMFAIDVSSVGVAFEGPAELKEDRYRIQFDLPSGVQVKGMGRVVWRRPNSFSHAYGVALERIAWREKLKLYGYIRRYLRAKGIISYQEEIIRFLAMAAATAAVLAWLLTKIVS